MACLDPRPAGFDVRGRLTFSVKSFSKSHGMSFRVPCGQCIECRLSRSREWAIRSVHETEFHKYSSFITLTYRDDVLPKRLEYSHFQEFIKRYRERLAERTGERAALSYFVVGEYGDVSKRPHWHCLLFGDFPEDRVMLRKTELEHPMWTSKFVDDVWGMNDALNVPSQIGLVSFLSAGYVARYAAKKLVHGRDQDHDFHPLVRCSLKPAIGRRWIAANWKFVCDNGFVYHPTKHIPLPVPRYYQKFIMTQPQCRAGLSDFIANRNRMAREAERNAIDELDKYFHNFDELKGLKKRRIETRFKNLNRFRRDT